MGERKRPILLDLYPNLFLIIYFILKILFKDTQDFVFYLYNLFLKNLPYGP